MLGCSSFRYSWDGCCDEDGDLSVVVEGNCLTFDEVGDGRWFVFIKGVKKAPSRLNIGDSFVVLFCQCCFSLCETFNLPSNNLGCARKVSYLV